MAKVQKVMEQVLAENERLRTQNADLLAACKYALAALDLGYDAGDGEAAHRLKAAIAKAEGGE